MEISRSREFYPYLKTGKIYFNHAAISPLSTKVLEKINEYLIQRSETTIETYGVFMKTLAETKEKLASLINTESDRIAFVDNTSNGLNIVAQGIEWNSGDRIILNDIEFPSNIYPYLNLKKHGVEIDFVKSQNGKVTAEDVIKMIKPSTKLISISSVQFLSGYRCDLDLIGEVCKSKGIVFSVDAIQSLGATNLDIQKSKIDFLACGTQKWLMALMGLAFIYISEELQDKLSHRYAGWLSVEDPWNLLNYDLKFRKTAEAFQNGTISAIGVTALNASLDFFNEFGYDKIENTIIDNSKYLINKLSEIGIEPILKNLPDKNLSGIVSFNCKNPKEVMDILQKENVDCALREGIVRFSPHYYNSKEEIDKVVELIDKKINKN